MFLGNGWIEAHCGSIFIICFVAQLDLENKIYLVFA